MASPVVALETGLYSALNTSSITTLATGGIWNRIAPVSQALPLVIFQWQGGGDSNDSPKRDRQPVYTVKAVAASASVAGSIDAAIDAVLHHQTLTVSGYTNVRTMREGDVDYAEITPAGSAIYHTGGMYRIWISE